MANDPSLVTPPDIYAETRALIDALRADGWDWTRIRTMLENDPGRADRLVRHYGIR